MPIALLPPVTRALFGTPASDPITEGPRYLRRRDWSRWHRPRSAYRPWPRTDLPNAFAEDRAFVAWKLWCGQCASDGGHLGPMLRADEVAAGDAVCGTCVGRALGAGQDNLPVGLPVLRFDPRWIDPPTLCPGSGREDLAETVDSARGSIARCLACGQLEAMRGLGGPYNPRYGFTKHPPGAELIAACWWHAWHHIVRTSVGTAGCACGWHQRQAGIAVTSTTSWEDAT